MDFSSFKLVSEKLDILSLINLCESNKEYSEFCDDDGVWLEKFNSNSKTQHLVGKITNPLS